MSAVIGAQLVLSWFLKDASWWVIFLVAYLGGAFASHTLYVCIHEAAHNLIFKKSFFNKIAAITANLPLVFPSAVSFQKYHLKHHSYQGVEELDADMPYRWEAKLINNSGLGKALWLLLYPIRDLYGGSCFSRNGLSTPREVLHVVLAAALFLFQRVSYRIPLLLCRVRPTFSE